MSYTYITKSFQEVEEGWFKFDYKNSTIVVELHTNRVYVSEYGKVVKDNLSSIPEAIYWVNDFGDRD